MLRAVFLLFSALTVVSSLNAQSAVKNEIAEATAEGRPPRADEKVERPRYFLWHDETGWHLHTRTGGKRHGFSGTVKVAGGKIYELRGVGGLEKKKDFGSINTAGNTVQYKFNTREFGDGLDFKINGTATRLDFDLKIDGYDHPQMIGIGREGTRPESSTFSIAIESNK